mgnify:CR=1 FL=1
MSKLRQNINSYNVGDDMRNETFKLMFEVDDYGVGDWRKPCSLQSEDLLEWLILHVRSIQNQWRKIGHCIIKRSGNGYHCHFPSCPPLSEACFNKIMALLPKDVGWLYWTNVYGVATLRISNKPVVSTCGNEFAKHLGTSVTLGKPQVIRIIYPNGKILYRKDIEQKYGDI